jgi:hypothetical protein
MDTFTFVPPTTVGSDTVDLRAYGPVPGLGLLPIGSFLIRGAEPVLVDTGPSPVRAEFMAALGTAIDPDDLRYVWLTHTDPDHTGALEAVLEAAPRARVVTTPIGVAKLGLLGLVPPDRLHVLLPGERLELADRTLTSLRPPTFDAPETIAAFDSRTRTLFSADTFATVVEAPVADAADLTASALGDGMLGWARVDTPWLAAVDPARFGVMLDEVRRLQPARILSSHLPPAADMTAALLNHVAATAAALATETFAPMPVG